MGVGCSQPALFLDGLDSSWDAGHAHADRRKSALWWIEAGLLGKGWNGEPARRETKTRLKNANRTFTVLFALFNVAVRCDFQFPILGNSRFANLFLGSYLRPRGIGGQSLGFPWKSAFATSCRATPLPSAIAKRAGCSAEPDHMETPAYAPFPQNV